MLGRKKRLLVVASASGHAIDNLFGANICDYSPRSRAAVPHSCLLRRALRQIKLERKEDVFQVLRHRAEDALVRRRRYVSVWFYGRGIYVL